MTDHKLEEDLKASSAEAGSVQGKSVQLLSDAEDFRNIKLVGQEDSSVQDLEELSNTDSKNLEINLANFQLQEELGSGALGTVRRAKNHKSEAEFAIRFLPKEYFADEKAELRAINAFKTISSINNPQLASYYHWGKSEEGSIYCVSDYIKGKTLAEKLSDSGVLSTESFVDIFRQICNALKSLHQHKIIHGDLKPSKIFIVSGESATNFVKVIDSGIFQALTEPARSDYLRKSARAGQPNYLSPEQCLEYGLDARSDIYSLGLIMYESLTGAPLITGHSQLHAMLKQLNLKPGSMKESGVPEALEKIVLKCLEKNRSARYFSVDDLEMDLDLFASDVSHLPGLTDESKILSYPPNNQHAKPVPNGKKKRFKRIGIGLGILAGVSAVSCIVVAVGGRHDATYWTHQAEKEIANAAQDASVAMQAPKDLQVPTQLAPTAKGSSKNLVNENGEAWTRPSPDPKRVGSAGAVSRSAQRHYDRAERCAIRAIQRYKLENLLRNDYEYVQRLAALQTLRGEIYMRDRFSKQTGWLDSKTWFDSTDYSGNLAEIRLCPLWPGIFPDANLQPDYHSAKVQFDKAAATLHGRFDANNTNLLWDMAYTRFQLGDISGSMETQQKLLELLQKQALPDKNALMLLHRNIAALYMFNGDSIAAGKAVHELKIARQINDEINGKIQGSCADILSAELAFAFLKEGKADVAGKIAYSNLQNMSRRADALAADDFGLTFEFNKKIFLQAFLAQGKEPPPFLTGATN